MYTNNASYVNTSVNQTNFRDAQCYNRENVSISVITDSYAMLVVQGQADVSAYLLLLYKISLK